MAKSSRRASSQKAKQTYFVDQSMPIGSYSRFDVMPPCGLASEHAIIGNYDVPAAFYDRGRHHATLLWFQSGFVEYRVAPDIPDISKLTSLEISMELCSEAPAYKLDHPSDICLSINGQSLGRWTSPGDFGGRRGNFTPDWWSVEDTQFGLLKTWRIQEDGTYLDGKPLSTVTLKQLNFEDAFSLRLEVPRTAKHAGGLNLMGRNFGDYAQDILARYEVLRE